MRVSGEGGDCRGPESLSRAVIVRGIHPDNFRNRVWPKLLAKAGLRKIRIHDLRHTYASLLIAQGESLAYGTVKDQMAHHSIRVTVDTYGHLVPGGNMAAVDRLDEPSAATIRTLAGRG